jgi:hypothetical protein
MIDVRIILSALWIALMFIFQQGDMLRIYSGDYTPGDVLWGKAMSSGMMWLISAITMTIPVVMIILSLTLKYPVNRWANIIVGIFFLLYSLAGLLGKQYPSAYDNFLLVVAVVVNVLTVWYAWKWVPIES